MKEQGVELFAVSVDPPEKSRRLKARLESRITYLSDEPGALLDALGIRHRAGRNDGVDISYPAAVLVDGGGIVRWVHQSETYRDRASAADIFGAIAELPEIAL